MTPDVANRYAKLGGIFFIVSMIAGFFGELYVPSKIIVPADAAATAGNLLAHLSMFRLSFAAYLIEATGDIALVWVFYILLKPAGRNLSLLAAFFGILSTAVFAGSELFYFAATYFVSGSKGLASFSVPQTQSLAFISLKLYAIGGGVFMTFYGTAMIVRGVLMLRSQYLPRLLGIIVMIAGASFVIRNFLLVLTPHYASDLLLAPMSVAGLAITVWFLAKGVDRAKWEQLAVT